MLKCRGLMRWTEGQDLQNPFLKSSGNFKIKF